MPEILCTWCELALHYVQDKLYENTTQAEIRDELDKMCGELKVPKLVEDCEEFVDMYGPSFEVIIAQKYVQHIYSTLSDYMKLSTFNIPS